VLFLEVIVPGLIRVAQVFAIVLLTTVGVSAGANPSPADDRDTVVIVFKDGHRQSLATAEVANIEFKAPASIVYKNGRREKLSGDIDRIEFGEPGSHAMTPGRSHFIGKWEVGAGDGNKFFITLKPDGDARKTLGSPHGTWTLVDGEARISWEDGWHDVIRKTGARHEKVAFEPGKSFDDTPSNVTAARNTEAKPI
jgi:hypothetical protein